MFRKCKKKLKNAKFVQIDLFATFIVFAIFIFHIITHCTPAPADTQNSNTRKPRSPTAYSASTNNPVDNPCIRWSVNYRHTLDT